MPERNDISFSGPDDDTLQKLSEFAKENLTEQQGLLLVIFAPTASQEDNVPASTGVDQLLAQLLESYMPGKPGSPIPCCVVPVKPPPPPPPPPPPEPTAPPEPEPGKPYEHK